MLQFWQASIIVIIMYLLAGGGGSDMTTLLDFRSCSGVSDSTKSGGGVDMPATFVTYVLGFQPSTWLQTVPTLFPMGDTCPGHDTRQVVGGADVITPTWTLSKAHLLQHEFLACPGPS